MIQIFQSLFCETFGNYTHTHTHTYTHKLSNFQFGNKVTIFKLDNLFIYTRYSVCLKFVG